MVWAGLEGLWEESLELREDIHEDAALRLGLVLFASKEPFWPLTFSLLFLRNKLWRFDCCAA